MDRYWHIEITLEELKTCYRYAKRLYRQMAGNGKGSVHKESMSPDVAIPRHFLGQIGECAVAKAFDQPYFYDEDDYEFHKPDIADLHVRSANRWPLGLTLTTSDSPDHYHERWVLVYVPHTKGHMKDIRRAMLVGWLTGHELHHYQFWRNDLRAPAWIAPPGMLHNMDKIGDVPESSAFKNAAPMQLMPPASAGFRG